MPPQYVYVLSDYDEHGAEHVTATLDRSRLLAMLGANWPDGVFRYGGRDKWLAEATASLSGLLAKSDVELAGPGDIGHNLQAGWGGAMLHVIKLV